MGHVFIKMDGKELTQVTIYCPYCGIGHKIDLSQNLGKRLAAGICTCGERLPEQFKDILTALRTVYEGVNKGGYRVEFDIVKDC